MSGFLAGFGEGECIYCRRWEHTATFTATCAMHFKHYVHISIALPHCLENIWIFLNNLFFLRFITLIWSLPCNTLLLIPVQPNNGAVHSILFILMTSKHNDLMRQPPFLIILNPLLFLGGGPMNTFVFTLLLHRPKPGSDWWNVPNVAWYMYGLSHTLVGKLISVQFVISVVISVDQL